MSDILREDFGSKGRYVLRRDGHEAEVTFSVLSPEMIIVDHTEVPEAMRGTGAGQAIVEFMVQDARTKGFRMMPLCPFVNAQRKKHPDWADAFGA